jgi:putative endonuclease
MAWMTGTEIREAEMGSGWVYILRCSDDSYYTGTTSDLEKRVSEHQAGIVAGYTSNKRPVKLIWSEHFADMRDAVAAERQIKGWSRAKKEALMRQDFEALVSLSKSHHAPDLRRKWSTEGGLKSKKSS